jgi:taurine dioxygenase
LSERLQEFLSTLTASHSFELGWGKAVRRETDGDERMRELNAVFPLRTHPETSRKSLFINQYYTTHINELSEKESTALLRLLFDRFTLPEFQLRHHWKQ